MKRLTRTLARRTSVRSGLRRQRSGYVLFVTLLMIAIVGSLTIGIARYSMNFAAGTINRQNELQSKWGVASCQRFAFSNYRELLVEQTFSDEANSVLESPIKRSEHSVSLGGQAFVIQLDNESAKLNLNLALSAKSKSKTEEIVRQRAEGLLPDLQPLSQRSRRGSNERGLESWGQVFAWDAPRTGQSRAAFASRLREGTESITCWGATTDYNVADDDVLSETITLVAGATTAAKVMRSTNEDFGAAVKELPAKQRTAVERVLKSTSSSHSVWIENRSKRRVLHVLSVREEYAPGLIRVKSFRW